MSELLGQLVKDHSRIRRLMEVLELEAARCPHDSSAPVVIRDVLDYMTSYPDRFHHPVEDELFRTLRQRCPGLRGVVATLAEDHRWITREGRVLLELAATEPPRPGLAERLARYARRQREHMRREEAEAFEAAARELDAGQWQGLEKQAGHHDDPLFGHVVQERYRELYAHIMRSHGRSPRGKRSPG